jgi:sarcosine oxidase gamma subunit
MGNSPHTLRNIEIDGVSVGIKRGLRIASLRYFDSTGRSAVAVREALGRAVPEPLGAVEVELSPDGARRYLLAWRSPSETLFLCSDALLFAELERKLAAEVDGCMVDQSSGMRAIRVAGPRAGDFLLRLGAVSAMPEPGGARSARLAELPVLTIGEKGGGFLMLVERVYANHLFEWINATAADF